MINNSGKIRITNKKGMSPNLLNFLDKCFKRKMEVRPTAYELLNHPFITREGSCKDFISDEIIDISLENEIDYSKYIK